MAHAFGLVGHACATDEVRKVGKKAKRTHYVERVRANASAFPNRTEREDMVVYQDDHALYLLRYALLLSLVLIVLDADFTALRLHLRCLLRFRARLLAPSSSLPSQLLPFDVVTMRPLAPLQR